MANEGHEVYYELRRAYRKGFGGIPARTCIDPNDFTVLDRTLAKKRY